MNEVTDQNSYWRMKASVVFAAWHDPAARILNVDLLALVIAILLPWSTSGVVIFVVLWLALAGTLWSDASWEVRVHAVGPASKLLALPLLLYHFERTTRSIWILVAFLMSATLLMLASWIVGFVPTLTLKWYMEPGVVVKNHIDQSHVFALCAVALAWPISILVQAKRFVPAGLLAAVSLAFVANMAFVNLSRTVLITLPVIVAIVVLHQPSWRRVAGILGALVLLSALGWTASPVLRAKTSSLFPPYRLYEPANEPTSIDIRYEYWRKSVDFIREAPVIGHGTGSTRHLFEQAAANQTGAAAEITSNPHNQTLSVAIQWGIVGVFALYVMWLSHAALFRRPGWTNWAGFLVVVQNIVSSLFNSHLSDFAEGWIYVLGVGVIGGMTLRDRSRKPLAPRP